ncbi:MAG: diheme cytochrome c [Mariprofundaceae bacterium]
MKKILALTLMVLFSPSAFADNFLDSFFRFKGVKPVTDELYRESCGECHFSFQPGLLPARSWKKMMLSAELEDHFGENAELDEEDRVEVERFLMEDAADHSIYKRSRKIARSVASGAAPLKITETAYIKRKHLKIPKEYIEGNRKVKMKSNCAACHRQAEKGIFDDDTILIPNYGYWSDLD